MKIRASIAAPIALVAVVIIAIAWITKQELHAHIEEIKTWIHAQGIWGAVAFIAAFVVLTSVMAPDSLMAVTAGAIFGFAEGIAVLLIAAALAMTFQYYLARSVLQHPVQGIIEHRPRLQQIERAMHKHQIRLQLLIRLTPMSPALVSYLVGAIGVRFGGALLAMISNIPAFLVQIYLGVEGARVVELAAQPESDLRLHDILKIAGVLLSLAALVVVSRSAVRAVNQAAQDEQQLAPTT